MSRYQDDDDDDRPRRRREYAAGPPPPEGNGLATASLVLGILSFITCGLTGIPAVLCGMLAFRKTNGRGAASVGMLFGVLSIALAIGGVIWLYNKGKEGIEGIPRGNDSKNLKQIGTAFHSRAGQTRMEFSAPYAADAAGRPNTGFSWRVSLLPHLHQDWIYNSMKWNQAWDSPDNKMLSDMPINEFRSPYDARYTGPNTPYRVFYGGGALFEEDGRPVPLTAIVDGTSNTILVIHAWDQVPWAAPRELRYDPKGPIPRLGHPNLKVVGTNALMADGSVRFITDKVSEKTLRNAITKADGNPLGSDW